MSATRLRALRIFRAAMKSARRCPNPQHAAEARSYVRLKFAERSSKPNLDVAEEELARFEYFHGVRESKSSGVDAPSYEEVLSQIRRYTRLAEASSGSEASLRQLQMSDSKSPGIDCGQKQGVARFCPSCGTQFRPSARFCAQCGNPRD